ncbi:MAG: hypothetical protein IKQ18_08420, partial [Clostridia bacterium]|nr:hypothetical protein [Clostridia bacterium]
SSLTVTGGTFISCTAKTNGGGLRTTTLEAEITGCLFKNNIASDNGGGISSTNTLATGLMIKDTVIDGCTGKLGGGVYFDGSKVKNAKLVISGTATKENNGEYTYSTVIQNNIASNSGGGVYTKSEAQLINAKIANNHLTTATATNAAGMYSSATVTFGETGAEYDATYVYDNTIEGGIQSNLRILGGNKAESVVVNCDLANGSRVGIINHGKLAEQFGTSPNSTNDPKWRPAGLSDPTEDRYPTFVADDGTLYGVIDRTDDNGVKIIWGGPPV